MQKTIEKPKTGSAPSSCEYVCTTLWSFYESFVIYPKETTLAAMKRVVEELRNHSEFAHQQQPCPHPGVVTFDPLLSGMVEVVLSHGYSEEEAPWEVVRIGEIEEGSSSFDFIVANNVSLEWPKSEAA